MNILDYFQKHTSVISLQFSAPEEVNDYMCNNFIINDKLYLLNGKGRVDYIIPLDTMVEENEEGFVMHNKFYPSPITVKTFFGGINGR
jgi:hypothetical protein